MAPRFVRYKPDSPNSFTQEAGKNIITINAHLNERIRANGVKLNCEGTVGEPSDGLRATALGLRRNDCLYV